MPKTTIISPVHIGDFPSSFNTLPIDRETAAELLVMLERQFINHKYTKVLALIKHLREFTGNQ